MARRSTDRWTAKRELTHFRGLLGLADEERQHLKDFDIALGMDDEAALTRLTDLFYYSSAWPVARGALAVYQGDAGGWQAIQTCFRRQALRRLVRFAQHDALSAQGFGGRGKPSPFAPLLYFELADVCRALLYAIATRENACAALLGDRLVAHLRQPDTLLAADAFQDTPFQSFAVLLYCRWQEVREAAVERLVSEPRRFTLLHSDAYRQVLAAWDAPDAFAAAVRGMVELRSKWTDLDDDPWSSHPYGVVPVEFLALKRVREGQGQPFQLPDHPMLQTPWAAPPAGLHRLPNDELWDKVVTRCRHFLPGLVLPPDWEPAR